MMSFVRVPSASHYWLLNGRVGRSLLSQQALDKLVKQARSAKQALQSDPWDDDLLAVDVEIRDGAVVRLWPNREATDNDVPVVDVPAVDLKQGLIWPCFVDVHTHLDKGHIWARRPNPDGTFSGALEAVHRDSKQRWDAEDVYRRAEFGLKCSYAHGTRAVRSHLDTFDEQGEISFAAFERLREAWRGRIDLQAVCLVTLDYFMDEKGEKLANLVASSGGILGGVAFTNSDVVEQINRVFELAKERDLDLDFHTDESLDPDDTNLRYVAEAAIRHDFKGRITCGHCCSLSVQAEESVRETIALVKDAGISVVSLPMCNLYLQGRQKGRTPRYRGVTVLHELKAAGVEVAIASDNCRDPFFAYGDHDGLEVFKQSARIGHLDHPIGEWPQAITSAPARMMGLGGLGEIWEGMSADLVVFKARSFNELMARGQSDRVVIRAGKQIDTTLPDYAELDDLMH